MFNRNVMAQLNKFSHLALAISGGRDSMALLDCYCNHRNELPPFFVINVHHNLREKEGLEDSLFVQEYCKKNNIECILFDEDIKTFCKNNHYTIEQGARLKRREIFFDIIDSGKADRVLTAHHLDDQCESVLMHLFRGCGLRGLQGMVVDDGKLFRPFLDITHAQIVEYCDSKNLPWRQDSSNFDNDYTRNKLRNTILPLVQEIYPTYNINVGQLAKKVADSVQALDKVMPTATFDGNIAWINIDDCCGEIESYNAIVSAISMVGSVVDITNAHINAIKQLASMKNGARINIPNNIVVWKEDNKLVFERQSKPKLFSCPFAWGDYVLGDWQVSVSKDKLEDSLMADYDKMQGCIFRTKRQGDKITKFGGGSKSLGDFLTDKKVARRLRDNMVIVAQDSQVMAVLPVDIAQNVAVNEKSNICYIKATYIKNT